MELNNSGSIDETLNKLVSPQILEHQLFIYFAKIHKNDYNTNLKFRPIISSYNSYAFDLAKRLPDVLNKSLIQNKTGTLNFIKKLKNLKISGNFKMLSLDIESLFPSIPL